MFRNTCAKGPRATRFGWILLHLQATLPEPKSALVTEVPKAQQTCCTAKGVQGFAFRMDSYNMAKDLLTSFHSETRAEGLLH